MTKPINCLVFLISLLVPFASTVCEEAKSITRVGVVLHLTGDLAMQSAAFREGVELGADEFNVSASGFRIETVLEDGQNNPKISNTAVQKLIDRDRVKVIILSSYLDAMASGALLERKQIPSLVLWDSSPEIDAIGDYTFAIGPWTPSAGQAAARFSRKNLGAATAAVLVNSDSWSEAVGKFFKQEFQQLGGTITEEATLGPADNDFRAVVSRLKIKNPDVVYSPLVFNLLPFYSQIRQQRLTAKIVTSDIIADEHISKAPSVFENIYQTGLLDPRSAEYEHLRRAYRAKFHHEIALPWFVAVGYDAMRLIGQAVTADGASGAAIKRAMYAIQNFKGASGVITINREGSSPQFEHMYQIKSGKLILVDTEG